MVDALLLMAEAFSCAAAKWVIPRRGGAGGVSAKDRDVRGDEVSARRRTGPVHDLAAAHRDGPAEEG